MTDQGFPVPGHLTLILGADHPQMTGPFGLWQAADVPKRPKPLPEIAISSPGQMGPCAEDAALTIPTTRGLV